MGIDRFELRRRNQIKPKEIPYKASSGMKYDSGDFPARVRARGRGRRREGLRSSESARARSAASCAASGIGSYLEVTAPPNKEMGGIRFEPNGDVTIITGTLDYGQGHAAPFAQVLSAKLGMPFERIRLLQGDSDELLAGGGTGGSRSMMRAAPRSSKAPTGDREGQADRRPRAGSRRGRHRVQAGRFAIAGTDRSIGIMELAEKLRPA